MAGVSGYSLDELYPPLDPALPGVLLRVVMSYAEDCELPYYVEVNGLGAAASAERKARPPPDPHRLVTEAINSELVHVLEWMRIRDRIPDLYPDAVHLAVSMRSGEVVKWMHYNSATTEYCSCVSNYVDDLLEQFVNGYHTSSPLTTVQWLYDIIGIVPYLFHFENIATSYRNNDDELAMLQWLLNTQPDDFHRHIFPTLVRSGSQQVLEWFVAAGGKFTVRECIEIAMRGTGYYSPKLDWGTQIDTEDFAYFSKNNILWCIRNRREEYVASFSEFERVAIARALQGWHARDDNSGGSEEAL